MCLCGKHFLKGVALHILPTTFIIYPPPSEFTHHLQKLPNTFRICPPPSEFTHHLQNLPTTFIIYPPPSDFTHHLQNKSVLGPLDLFVSFFDMFVDPKNVNFGKHDFVGRKFWKNSSTMSLFLILPTWWTYSQPIWIAKVQKNSKILPVFPMFLFPHFGPYFPFVGLGPGLGLGPNGNYRAPKGI